MDKFIDYLFFISIFHYHVPFALITYMDARHTLGFLPCDRANDELLFFNYLCRNLIKYGHSMYSYAFRFLGLDKASLYNLVGSRIETPIDRTKTALVNSKSTQLAGKNVSIVVVYEKLKTPSRATKTSR